MSIYCDLPKSEGIKNVLKRAKQMTDFCWCPVRAMPAGYGHWTPEGELSYANFFFPKYQPQTGIIYSSVRDTQKYVGSNVSFETFVSCLTNPNSVLYTRPLHGKGKGMFSYYGITCSIFVCYAFNISIQIPCIMWTKEPSVHEVDTSSSLDNIELCDFLLEPNSHIALITEIRRDADGHIVDITVSEGTQPKCLVTRFTAKQFEKYWLLENSYKVYRYDNLDNVPYNPTPYVPLEGDPNMDIPQINEDILPDYGDCANYEFGEPVEFTLFDEKWTHVAISGSEKAEVPVINGSASYLPKTPGYYETRAISDCEVSTANKFYVTSCNVSPEKAVFSAKEEIWIDFENTTVEDEIIGYIVNDKRHYVVGRQEFDVKLYRKGKICLGTLPAGSY